MKKNLMVTMVLLLGVILFSNTVNAETTNPQHADKADALKALGLFQGTKNGYELDRVATRVEGAVMLVRLLGKEQEAIEKNYSHPFTDVPAWASSSIGYVYTNGITNGLSNSKFGSNDALSSQQYATFILRALGYDDKKGDFTWNTSLETMEKQSMISATELKTLKTEQFLRDDTVLLSYYALQSNMKSGQTLLEYLISQNIITDKQIDSSLINGPIKLDINKLPEVRVIVTANTTATAFVNKTKLSDDMKAFNKFKVVKFNSKAEADRFESFIQDSENAKQIDAKVSEINKFEPGFEHSYVSKNTITLYPGTTYSSQDPPFDTYLFLIYYNENGSVYGYSDYYIPFNKIDDLLAEITYPIKLNQLPHFENLYRMENFIAQDWGQQGIYRVYRAYNVDESFEKYQKQYGEFIFSVNFSTIELIDLNVPLDYKTLKERSENVSSFAYFKTQTPGVNGSTIPKNYDYYIYFDYNLKPLGYSITELPKKAIE